MKLFIGTFQSGTGSHNTYLNRDVAAEVVGIIWCCRRIQRTTLSALVVADKGCIAKQPAAGGNKENMPDSMTQISSPILRA
jgi:hypothetical protein